MFCMLWITLNSQQISSWEQVFHQLRMKFPQMSLQDYVKFVYLGTYGNYHMLMNPTAARKYLEKEYSSLQPVEGNLLMCISPDSSWWLLDLQVARFHGIPVGNIWNAMKISSRQIFPHRERLLEGIDHLRLYTNSLQSAYIDSVLGVLHSTPDSTLPFLIFHHSPEFIRQYHPSYRVIHRTALGIFQNCE